MSNIPERLLEFTQGLSQYKTITCPECEHIFLETEGNVVIDNNEIKLLCPKCQPVIK